MEQKIEVCLFFRYLKSTRGGLFCNPKDRKVIVSAHAVFLETDYMNQYKPRSKVVPEEMLGPITSTKLTKVVKLREVESSSSQQPRVFDTREIRQTTVPIQGSSEPRRSGMVICLLECYGMDNDLNFIVRDTSADDLLFFQKEMVNPDKDK